MLSWLPENISTYGSQIDQLFYLIYWITGITFVLVNVTLIAFLVMYRHRNDGRRATYTHGNTTLEIIWTIIPALILIMLGFMSKGRWDEIKGQLPPSDIEVQVTGKQFNWEIVYPGPDHEFGTADDVQMDNDLYVPVNKVVRVRLLSKDVIHSFFLPHARLKQDTMPGRTIMAWFEVTKTGEFEIPCAELCGFGHSGMKGRLLVKSPADYQQWIAEQWPTQQTGKTDAPTGESDRG